MERRPSQVRAYRKIMESGLLTRRREEIYDWLFHQEEPVTAGEAAAALSRDRGATSARLGDLVRLTVAREAGERKCRISGMTVLQYEVTDNLPIEEDSTSVQEVTITLVFGEGQNPTLYEEAVPHLASEDAVDYDIKWRIRTATNRELALLSESDAT